MCGRFTHLYTWEQLHEYFDSFTTSFELTNRYNVAPSQNVPVIRLLTEGVELAPLKWGLVPSWAKDPKIGNALINARVETIQEKPSFRDPFKRRRCIVPASGFYEWKKIDSKTKQPYYMTSSDGKPLLLAGLWDQCNLGDTPLTTFTIITCPAISQLASIHERMPMMLQPGDINAWLRGPVALDAIIQQSQAREFVAVPVSTRVNSPAFDGVECIVPLTTL